MTNEIKQTNDDQSRTPAPRAADPFAALRAEMDRVFDSFSSGFGPLPSIFGSRPFGERLATPAVGTQFAPHVDVRENAEEIAIDAELPGIEEKDISLTVQDGVLTLSAEKKLEKRDEKDNYHMLERRYGTFQRALRLPDSVDEDKIEASFDKGVLKVRLPKRPEAAKSERRIEIKN